MTDRSPEQIKALAYGRFGQPGAIAPGGVLEYGNDSFWVHTSGPEAGLVYEVRTKRRVPIEEYEPAAQPAEEVKDVPAIEVSPDPVQAAPPEEPDQPAEEPPPDADAAVVERKGFRLVRRPVKRHRQPGVYRAIESEPGKGEEEAGAETQWLWFASPIEVLALARTASSEGWALVLKLVDPDGVAKRIAMPMGDLDAGNSAWRQRLRNAGLQLAPGPAARTALEAYLVTSGSTRRALSVTTTGWKEV